MSEHHNTVCVDFDGVICASDGPYTKDHFGPPIRSGIMLLRMLQRKGYDVVILTARKETDSVAVYLAHLGFPNMIVTNHKIPALAYVDDRAVHAHEGASALSMLREIEKRPKR